MKKILLLLIFIFSTSVLFGAYDIKLGVFKNVKNLRANIAKVKPYTFRKQIIVKKRKGFYYTNAIVKGSSSQAKKALIAYQRIFQDAFIAGQIKPHKKTPKKKLNTKKMSIKKVASKKSVANKFIVKKATSKKIVSEKVPPMVAPVVKSGMIDSMNQQEENTPVSEMNSTLIDTNLSKEAKQEVSWESQSNAIVEDVNHTKKNTFKVVDTRIVTVEEVEKKVAMLNAKEVLFLKTVYLCYEDGPAHLGSRVVQLTFNKDMISYSPLDNEESGFKIAYKMEENKVILSLMDISMVHKIVEKKEEYLSVESYVGDKNMHTLRYYFDEQLALKYLKGK